MRFGAAELARAGERRDPPLRDADLAVLDAPSRHREAASHDEVQHRLSLELVSRGAFVVGGLEASGSGSRLADPVGTHSRAGIRSREAPGTLGTLSGPGSPQV